MSQSPFTAPLSLSIKSTPQKWMMVLFPHLLVGILVLFFDVFSIELKLILIFLIIASAIYYSRLYLFQNLKKSITVIQQDSARNWSIISNGANKKEEKITATLLPSSFISKVLIILNYKDSVRRKYSVIITPDSLSDNKFRRLRVRLNYSNDKK